MSTSVNSILPEYSPRFIPEDTKIELPYTENGKLSKEIDELSELEFNMLKEEVAIIAYGLLGIEQEYEAIMESPTFSLEAIEMNNKHVALVTSKAEEFANVNSNKVLKINPATGKVAGYKELSAAVVEHSEGGYEDGGEILPLSIKDGRLAVIGAMLHDVQKNKIFTSEEERLMWHHLWSAEEASQILTIAGLKKEDIAQVSTMIIEHQPMPFVSDALSFGVDDPGHKWAKAKDALPSREAYQAGTITEVQQKMYDAWNSGKFERPTSKAAAVLFCADLLAPGEVFDSSFLKKFKESGSSSLREYFDSQREEFDMTSVAAGSFDRYVLANLRWGRPLADSFQSSYMSLRNNVLELANEVSKVEEQESELPADKYNARMEAAWTMNIIARSYGQTAISRMSEVHNSLSKALQEEKAREVELPPDEQILTKYEDLYFSLMASGAGAMSQKEKNDTMEELNKLKPAYITKSMYLLYSSALPSFAED